jgi:hypothetical protein
LGGAKYTALGGRSNATFASGTELHPQNVSVIKIMATRFEFMVFAERFSLPRPASAAESG